jgi:macrolide-specific efflux system membrane fusion protein
VLAVPSAAVTTADGTSTVTVVVDDGTQTKTEVEVGDTAGEYTEIVSGIDEGTTVLVASFTPGEDNAGTGRFPAGGTGRFPGGGTGELPGGDTGQFPGGDEGGKG